MKKKLSTYIQKNVVAILFLVFIFGLVSGALFENFKPSEQTVDKKSVQLDTKPEWQRTVGKYAEFEQVAFDSLLLNVTDKKHNCLFIGVSQPQDTRCLYQQYPDDSSHIPYTSEEDRKLTKMFCSFADDTVLEKKFDGLISLLSLHHLSYEEKQNILKGLYDCLEEDGVLVIGDIVRLESEQMQRRANQVFADTRFQNLSVQEQDRFNDHVNDITHTFHTLQELRTMLVEAGFKDVDIVWMYYTMGIIRAVK